MKPVRILPLSQVEYAVDDLDRVTQFFKRVFAEQEVEERFAGALSNELLEIHHVGFGKTVQQLCRPPMPGLPHFDALQALGPCVHNLCFMVDDIEAMVFNCREASFDSLIDFPLDELWQSLIEADNLEGDHHAWIFDTRADLGFQLELAEVPWREEPRPPLMLPAFSENWQALGKDSGVELLAINIAVEDAGRAVDKLTALFGDQVQLLAPAGSLPGGEGFSARVRLGEVELCFIQPTRGALLDFLEQTGPAVHSLVARVPDLDLIGERLQDYDLATREADEALLPIVQSAGSTSPGRACLLGSRALIGVDLVLF